MTAEKPKTSRGVRIILVASLAVNLLVLGLAMGAVFSGRAGGPPRFDLNLGPYARALNASDRQAIGQTLRDRNDLRPMAGGERRAAKQAFLDALRADPFDPTLIEDQLSAQRDRTMRLVNAGQAAMIERINGMSNEQRVQFADRLDRELRHHPAPRDRR